MESGYYSEMENLGSASLCISEPLGSYSEGLAQRNRPVKGRPSSSGRRKREFISDEKKDASYWEKRRKNNEAAKRSREKRRISDMVLENRVLALNEENVRLKSELLALKLRFGLITTAAYTEKSRQLAGTSVSSYYSSFSNTSSVLLNSDSSEAEHSSRGGGFTPMSKYSPRGSLSDISDGLSSTGDSPEPVIHGDVKQDDNLVDRDLMKDIKEVVSVRVTYEGGEAASLLRSCDDIEFINYKEPVKYNLVPRDIIQYRAQGYGEDVQTHSAQREDFHPTSAVPQHSQAALMSHGLGYAQLVRHTISAKPLTVRELHDPPSLIGFTQQYSRELSDTEAQKLQGHLLPKESVIEISKKPPTEHSAKGPFGVLEGAHSLHSTSKDGELVESDSQCPDSKFPQCSTSHNSQTGKQEPLECPFTPCSVIEVPRVSDQGAITHSNITTDKVSDCTLSEGSDSDSQEKVDGLGYDTLVHSGTHQEVRRTALPHKLRLKVRAMLANEQQVYGQDHSQQVSDPGLALQKHNSFHQNSTFDGCIMKNYISVTDEGELWRKSGLLDIKTLQCQPGGLNNLQGHVPNGTNSHQNYQNTSTSSSLHAVKAAYFKAFERNTVQSPEKLSLHKRNHLVSPTEG
ncbi:nuclear factor, interleukin 3 regulated, member 2 [Carcharodon carcharias]|uniref:nuclear factor, interleukin 3 regulated, member 2 n=1 Tax=Carcharodon carcharias TaxID=13397 RepID=UPI001B7F76EC|nr:nuclear factor, interleukin 3 regulated, member 2 [Carcharodon carcharias]